MLPGANTVVRHYADALSRRGTLITWRRVSRLAGGDPQPNPPTLIGPVLNGAAGAGTTVISIRAAAAAGRILAGDMLAIGALAPIPVAVAATATAPGGTVGFAGIQLASGLPSAQLDGAPVVPTWLADTSVRARVSSYPVHLLSDQILSTDLSVEMAAFGVTQAPTPQDLLVINGDVRTIVTVLPTWAAGMVVKWTVQAR